MDSARRLFYCYWLLALGLLTFAGPARSADDEAGFKPLFNGKDLTGWDGSPRFWSVKDGCIVGETTDKVVTPANTFLIWRDGKLDDFELRCEYKLSNHNSGIQYRSKDLGDFVVSGYQADMAEVDKFSGIVYEEKARGILCNRGDKTTIDAEGKPHAESFGDAAKLGAMVKKGEWNDYTIIAQGNHLIHKINGQVMADLTDNQVDKRSLSGILALQLHAGKPMKVEFRNLRLKRLPLADVKDKTGSTPRKKIVLVAGTPSHNAGDHEFNAGSTILKTCLDENPGVQTALYRNGWPRDPTAFDNADSIVLYLDGGINHPLLKDNRLKQFASLMDRGVGLACLHYAVEVQKDDGGPEFLKWLGGYYERDFSVNPFWVANYKSFPKHPVARGVEPFAIRDEWYFNIRFKPEMSGVTPILVSTPKDDARVKTEAAKANKGREEVTAWCFERPDGGRSFGFTGGHTHTNWSDGAFRKLVLNALLWTAKVDVPQSGAASQVTQEQITANLDSKPPHVPGRNAPPKK